VDSRDQLLYTDCPPTRLRAVRIRRKQQQKPKQTLVTTEPTLESRIRKEREKQPSRFYIFAPWFWRLSKSFSMWGEERTFSHVL